MRIVIFVILTIILSSGCNSGKIKTLEAELQAKKEQLSLVQEQLEIQQSTNASLLGTLSELSVINKVEAQSIQSSLESIIKQNAYIRNLTDRIHEKDSINFVLVSNLKRSLDDFYDEDIAVEVRGSAVYISIADKMLFQTASASVSPRAFEILGKVAKVINDHDQMEVMVEGHTDNVPIANSSYEDNWDLSVSRATAVVRLLQERFDVHPGRLTAAGRASYQPKSVNNSDFGRSLNRRTEIIIKPKLDQFFELLRGQELAG